MVIVFIAAAAAFLLTLVVSSKFVEKLAATVRGDEERKNIFYEEPEAAQVKWHIAHIRDDLAGVFMLLQLIAALLSAILAVLIIR